MTSATSGPAMEVASLVVNAVQVSASTRVCPGASLLPSRAMSSLVSEAAWARSLWSWIAAKSAAIDWLRTAAASRSSAPARPSGVDSEAVSATAGLPVVGVT